MLLVVLMYLMFLAFIWMGLTMSKKVRKSRQPKSRPGSLIMKVNKFAGKLGKWVEPRIGEYTRKKIEAKLSRFESIEVHVFMGYKILISALLMLAAVMLVSKPVARAGAGGIALVAGYVLPDLVLYHNLKASNRDIVLDLPYILDLLYISTLSGQNIYRSIQIMIKNYRGRICSEFKQFIQDINLGRGKSRAYHRLIDSPNPDQFKDALMLLNTAESCGSNISDILRQKSDQIKFEVTQEAERKARKDSLFMLFPLALLILPSFVLMVGGPLLFSFGRDFLNF